MANTKSKEEKIAALRGERQKQMELFRRLPDQKGQAAQDIAKRIHQIDKGIAGATDDSSDSGGVPIWAWLLLAIGAGGIAWAGTYFFGGALR